MTDDVKKPLDNLKTQTIVFQLGCIKYTQASDLVCGRAQEFYDK